MLNLYIYHQSIQLLQKILQIQRKHFSNQFKTHHPSTKVSSTKLLNQVHQKLAQIKIAF